MNLTHPPEYVVKSLLEANAIGWTTYASLHPDQPDNSLCVYGTDGRTEGKIQFTGETVTKFGIQVRIRANEYLPGYAKAKVVHDLFDAVYKQQVTIDSSTYLVHAIHNSGNVFSLGLELAATRRRLWTVNAVATITET